MIISEIGKDVIFVNESNFMAFDTREKIHIIKLDLILPTKFLMDQILRKFDQTKRFIIDKDIKFYNDYFKTTHKKYYVENFKEQSFISFLKKNNKVCLNFNKLIEQEKQFLKSSLFSFSDLLNNLEVLILSNQDYISLKDIINNWEGNLIISNN